MSSGNKETRSWTSTSILKAPIGTAISTIRTTVSGLTATAYTPLANRLIATARYFKHDNYFPGAADPVQYSCQRNFVVIMTDGRPTFEGDLIASDFPGEFDYIESWLGQPWDYDGDGNDPDPLHVSQPAYCTLFNYCGRNSSLTEDDPTCEYAYGGSDYLDDVSKKIYDTDLRSDMSGKQTLATYTIGFTVANNLLQRTAQDGGGEYFTANSSSALDTAFKEALKSIVSNTETFVAPVIPVSQTVRTQSGDDVYLGLFRPRSSTLRWEGNVKKFKLDANGQLIDANGQLATDSTGNIKSTALSYWEATPSGQNVSKGGVGGLLLTRAAARNIYTNLLTVYPIDLTAASNKFATTNALITPTLLGLTATDTVGKDKLVNYVTGLDAYDEDVDTNVTEKRAWIMGDVIHSQPIVVPYTNATDRVIMVGANDGMFHAFDENTGDELWAFIPDIVLSSLKLMPPGASATHPFYVDGPAAFRVIGAKKYVVFGLGRGGRAYYALDVTNRTAPKLAWKFVSSGVAVAGAVTVDSDLGQSWSAPVFTKASGTEAVILGGGYDPAWDDPNKKGGGSIGDAVYVLNTATGAMISKIKPGGMDVPIPSTVAVLDLNADGSFDRAYVGDLTANMWRIDGKALTGAKLFDSQAKGLRIFYPPDVTRGTGYLSLFFGTGDRSNPLDLNSPNVPNRMYKVKDDGVSINLKESNLVDVTSQVKQNGSAAEGTLGTQIDNAKGWYIQFAAGTGEKILSSPSVYYDVYFTSFTPVGGVCSAGGDARLYTLNEHTGGIPDDVADPDGDGPNAPKTVTAADRVQVIGTGIPTEMTLTIQKDRASGFVGTTGGLDRVALPQFPNNVTPLSWRECSTRAPCP